MQKNNREVYKLELGYFHLEFIDSHFYHEDCARETMASVESALEIDIDTMSLMRATNYSYFKIRFNDAKRYK